MIMHKKVFRIVVTMVLLIAAIVLENTMPLSAWQVLLVYLVPYLLIGYDVLGEAFEGLFHLNPLDENVLMSVATIGALTIGFLPKMEMQCAEAVAVMLFFQIGEMFEHAAAHRSRRAIGHLLALRPKEVTVERDGELRVPPSEVRVGEVVVVRPGDKIPLDGTIVEGNSTLDTRALTGESMPRKVVVGAEVLSGCVNLSGLLRVRVSKPEKEGTVAKIIALVEQATNRKSRSEAFITRFARIYTPIVVWLAVALAAIPPLFAPSYGAAFPIWLARALTFLVVSCPCALVLSVPLTFFAGLGGASRKGILIKGSSFMESLAKVHTVAFDKTGTLTKGEFAVTAVHPERINETTLLHLAAHVERYSTHPIAEALRNAYPDEADDCSVESVEETSGQGVCAVVEGRKVCVGNERMMDAMGVSWHSCSHSGTIAHVCIDGEYAGHIVISDCLKDDALYALTNLRKVGVSRTVMLTGDRKEVAVAVAKELLVDDFVADLLPQDKVAEIQKNKSEIPAGRTLLFVGDGINDAPVLAAADVGVAMGALGSDAAIEAADVVLMDDKLSKIGQAILVARRTLAIARQNIVFAIGIKILVLWLAVAGLAGMWPAVFADVGVMVLCVFNAMRALKIK